MDEDCIGQESGLKKEDAHCQHKIFAHIFFYKNINNILNITSLILNFVTLSIVENGLQIKENQFVVLMVLLI